MASVYEGDWAGLKGAYRFLDNDAVTPAAILAPHTEATWARGAGLPRVLVAQDTTYFNFTRHPATVGLGPIQSVDDHRLIVHSALAMTPEGVPLGPSVK